MASMGITEVACPSTSAFFQVCSPEFMSTLDTWC